MRPNELRLRIARLEAELTRLKTLLASTAYLNPERQSAFLATRQKVLNAFAHPITPSAALKLSRLTRQSFTRHFRKLRHQGFLAPVRHLPGAFITLTLPHSAVRPSPSLSPEQAQLLAQKEIDQVYLLRYALKHRLPLPNFARSQ